MAPLCLLRAAGCLLDVTDGWLTNPNTRVSVPLNFFYLSKDSKMIVIERADALYAMKQNVLAYSRKVGENLSRNDKRLEHRHRKLKQRIRRIAQNRLNQYRHNHNSSSSVDFDSDFSESTSYVITTGVRLNYSSSPKEECLQTNGDQSFNYHNDSANHIQISNNENKKDTHNGLKGMTYLDIDSGTLCIIRKWLSRNTTFIKYRGMTDVPSYLFDTDRNYFKKVLFALSPKVVIEKCVEIYKKKKPVYVPPVYTYIDIQSQISQSDFVSALGLKPFNTSESKVCKTDSNRSIESTEVDKRKSSREKKSTAAPPKNSKWIKQIAPTNDSQKAKQTPRSSKRKSFTHNPYQPEEDRTIINWALRGINSKQVSGNNIWKQLEEKRLLQGRTWQSLRSRYLKTILFKLRDYGLSYEDEMKLKVGVEKGTLPKMKLKIPDYRVIANKENSAKSEAAHKNNPPLKTSNKKDVYNGDNISKDDVRHREPRRKSDRITPANINPKTGNKMRKLFTENSYIASASSNM